MNNGVIFFTPDSNNNVVSHCGAIGLPVSDVLEKQETYKERHKSDFSSKSILAKVVDTLKPSLILCTIILIVFKLIIINGFIPSESMQPTLNIGDGIVANRLAYVSASPRRGDVIVFNTDEYSGDYLIKRVVGLPGDVIDLKGGCVYVNGCKLVEDYAHGVTMPSLSGISHYEVPEDSVFLLGDNREFSADSRWWENPYVSYDDIIGKASLQYSLNFTQTGFFANTIDSSAPSFINE